MTIQQEIDLIVTKHSLGELLKLELEILVQKAQKEQMEIDLANTMQILKGNK